MAFDADYQAMNSQNGSAIGGRADARPSHSPAARAFRASFQLIGWAALGFVVLALLNTAIRG